MTATNKALEASGAKKGTTTQSPKEQNPANTCKPSGAGGALITQGKGCRPTYATSAAVGQADGVRKGRNPEG